ncbi:molybdopterin molybdotransferase MoeA [Dyella amyloliquefaciens]|uniref:molybdopterin molybdotransferase MoeA n=1 Tax=Dyella amyloliquefaciens TaxID=1770545 RepID=UPI00102E4BDC|nr:molybdopterin molybdotransferase MoeA [Dyella amyloliquefaciens]
MTELISVAQAEALIAEHMSSFGSEPVSLHEAAGRILRQPVHAEHDHPPFDRVMMDGIAIRWHETLPRAFTLAGMQLAGMSLQALVPSDACIEVTTGAMRPTGCDCVIPVEQTRREGELYHLADGYQPARGQFIHSRGSDCVAGEPLLDVGTPIGAPEIALLAANGFARVEVASIPSIAILSTGDELVEVGASLGEGQIRRSNDIAVATAMRLHGFGRVTIDHVADDQEATRGKLAKLLAAHDVLILSGGVSMGQRDYVPSALEALEVRRVFHRIAQKPGKPMWFGVGSSGQAVFALPGNPVSALVCAIRYVRPALLAAMGTTPTPMEMVCLDAAMDTNVMLTSFVPAHVHTDAQGLVMAHPVPSRTSGDFSSLPRTHGVVQLPPGLGPVPAGTIAAFYRW